MVGIGRVGGEGIALGKRRHDDILRVVWRAEDGIVAVDSWLLDAGYPVETRLLSIGVDMIHHRLDVRESCAIRNGPAALVETTLPAGIEVDVDEAVLLQARGFECVGLGDHVRLRQEVALDGLLAEAAPAEIGFLAGVIHLGGRAGQESDNPCNYGVKGEILQFHTITSSGRNRVTASADREKLVP